MKRVFLALSFAAISLAASAQKGFTGHWILSGDLSYTSSNPTGATDNTSATQSTFKIVPIVGVFAAPKTLVGLGIGYAYIDNFAYNDGEKAHSWVFKPLVRQFFPTHGDGKFFIWGQLDVPIMPGGVTVPGWMVDGENSVKVSGTQWGVEVRPGLTYLLSNHWQIEGSLGLFGYSHCVNPALNAAASPSALPSRNEFSFGVFSGNLHGDSPVFDELTLGITHFF